jgi:hypothetical protein
VLRWKAGDFPDALYGQLKSPQCVVPDNTLEIN